MTVCGSVSPAPLLARALQRSSASYFLGASQRTGFHDVADRGDRALLLDSGVLAAQVMGAATASLGPR
jgi:hypothetical protein